MHALAQSTCPCYFWFVGFLLCCLLLVLLDHARFGSRLYPKEGRGLLPWPTARPDRLCHNGARACKRYITPTSLVSHISPFSYAGCSHAVFYCRHIYKTFHARPNKCANGLQLQTVDVCFPPSESAFPSGSFPLSAYAADRRLRAHGSSTGWFFSSPF